MLLLPVPARPNHSLHCALVAEETSREMKITVAMKRRGRVEKEEAFGGERVHVAEERMFSVETSFSFGR